MLKKEWIELKIKINYKIMVMIVFLGFFDMNNNKF